MARIVLDANQVQQLYSSAGRVELCDASGKVLAEALPVPRPLAELADWEPVTPDVSDQEIERRLNSKAKNLTTAEVLAHLRKL
jgi:hypothetical protein